MNYKCFKCGYKTILSAVVRPGLLEHCPACFQRSLIVNTEPGKQVANALIAEMNTVHEHLTKWNEENKLGLRISCKPQGKRK